MYFKCIIQGRLEFGTRNSYDKVIKMYDYRTENYYRDIIIFKAEDIFLEDELALSIPRHVSNVTEKSFRNTSSLIEYCAQFAVSGSVHAWQIDEGNIMHYIVIEPGGDKAAVQSFIKGRDLVKEKGMESEALLALSKAIEKYNRHAQAYERRAKVNFILKKYHDAKRDYGKSILIDPTIPTAYYGRGKILMLEENWTDAIQDFEMTTKYAIALQPVYWKARRLKAQCHIKLKEWNKAEFDLRFYTKRSFEKEDPNFVWRRWAFYHYGLVLMELGKYSDAIAAFDQSLVQVSTFGQIEDAQLYKWRGLAKHKAGKTGFAKDLKEASKLGDKQATTLLKELSS